tara:strand:- start:633 stop:1031 length:399 start_codon:yes stop_codon:yes gene_type:complete
METRLIKTYRVLEALNDWEKTDFHYGRSDCCQFAGFITERLTGKNYLSQFSYEGKAEADALIEKHNGLGNLIDSLLGESVSIEDLNDGNPVLMKLPIVGELLGIWLGNVGVGVTEKGLVRVLPAYCVRGWVT